MGPLREGVEAESPPAGDPGAAVVPTPAAAAALDGDFRLTARLFLHYKPGPEERRPPIVAPHQPRVDFQLWFFTLGRDGGVHPYFDTLVRRLCTRPAAVAALFLPESMPPGVPAALRVAYYRYRMTDRLTLARERRYWSRELLGYHPVAYFCDSTAPPRF
jgi:lipase maturation factor